MPDITEQLDRTIGRIEIISALLDAQLKKRLADQAFIVEAIADIQLTTSRLLADVKADDPDV